MIPKVKRNQPKQIRTTGSKKVYGSNSYSKPLLTVTETARENWLKRYKTQTTAGESVTEDNALDIDTVFTCVRVVAESMAALPFELLETIGTGDTAKIQPALDDPIYEMVRYQSNPEQTAYEVRLWMMIDCLIRGRGVAQILRDGEGNPLGMYPLLARHLYPRRAPDDNRLVYTYAYVGLDDTKKEILLELDEVLMIQMMPYAGLIGYSLVQLQREALGASKASERYSSEFFANGGTVSGVIEIPETLDEEAYNRLKKDWKESHTAKGKRHGVPILEGDAKFHELALNHEETQLLETRKFQRSTIAGLFRVPAHLINDLADATFSNIEQQSLNFAIHTLRPWMTNWEQKARMILLTPEKRRNFMFKHDDRDLLRGDLPSRATAFGTLIQNGVMSPNDARRAEGWNPYVGGDVYFVNGSLRPTDEPYSASTGSQTDPNTDPAANK